MPRLSALPLHSADAGGGDAFPQRLPRAQARSLRVALVAGVETTPSQGYVGSSRTPV